MLITDLLIGVIISAGFPIGYLLYLWSKEEVDFVLDKFKFINYIENISLLFAIIIGVLVKIFLENTFALLILLMISIIISSLVKNKIRILQATALCLVAFFVFYFMMN